MDSPSPPSSSCGLSDDDDELFLMKWKQKRIQELSQGSTSVQSSPNEPNEQPNERSKPKNEPNEPSERSTNVSDQVHEQYEQFPYPPRAIEDEEEGLCFTSPSNLLEVNQFVFGGKRDFTTGTFRVLVAGCGTGDATVLMCHQLSMIHRTNCEKADSQIPEVVCVDISSASLQITRSRCEKRRLCVQPTLVKASLDDAGQLKKTLRAQGAWGQFDYIDCSGVLHHLNSPERGLRTLSSLLKPSGGIGLMVYGEYGRTGVYHMQMMMKALRRANNLQEKEREKERQNRGTGQRENTDNDQRANSSHIGETRENKSNEKDTCNLKDEINLCRTLLDDLPNSNWLRKNPLVSNCADLDSGAGIVDLFLHARDRAYTIPQLISLVQGAGLVVSGFPQHRLYDVESNVHNPEIRRRVHTMCWQEQYAFVEAYTGCIARHICYAVKPANMLATSSTSSTEGVISRPPLSCFPLQPMNIPLFAFPHSGAVASILHDGSAGKTGAGADSACAIRALVKLVNGKRTFDEIVALLFSELALTDGKATANAVEKDEKPLEPRLDTCTKTEARIRGWTNSVLERLSGEGVLRVSSLESLNHTTYTLVDYALYTYRSSTQAHHIDGA